MFKLIFHLFNPDSFIGSFKLLFVILYMENMWSIESWKKLTAEQQPNWQKVPEYSKVISEISNIHP